MAKRFWFGMSVMMLAFAVTVIGCDNGGNDDVRPIHGTWVDEEGDEITFHANGDWTEYFEGSPMTRGTFVTSGDTITIIITELHSNFINEVLEEMGDFFPGLSAPPGWHSSAQIRAIIAAALSLADMTPEEAEMILLLFVDTMLAGLFAPQEGTFSISGNTLTITVTITVEGFTVTETITFTRR